MNNIISNLRNFIRELNSTRSSRVCGTTSLVWAAIAGKLKEEPGVINPLFLLKQAITSGKLHRGNSFSVPLFVTVNSYKDIPQPGIFTGLAGSSVYSYLYVDSGVSINYKVVYVTSSRGNDAIWNGYTVRAVWKDYTLLSRTAWADKGASDQVSILLDYFNNLNNNWNSLSDQYGLDVLFSDIEHIIEGLSYDVHGHKISTVLHAMLSSKKFLRDWLVDDYMSEAYLISLYPYNYWLSKPDNFGLIGIESLLPMFALIGDVAHLGKLVYHIFWPEGEQDPVLGQHFPFNPTGIKSLTSLRAKRLIHPVFRDFVVIKNKVPFDNDSEFRGCGAILSHINGSILQAIYDRYVGYDEDCNATFSYNQFHIYYDDLLSFFYSIDATEPIVGAIRALEMEEKWEI